MPTVEYDSIAREYRDSKQLPFRKYVEAYSLFSMAGDLRHLRVLDLACGEGFYTRQLKRAGAVDVLGVDLSPEMIQLAEASERERPLGCRYLVHDVATLPCLGAFDRVVAVYLLNYAQSYDQLLAFCQAAFRHLRPGGELIGFNDNMENDPAHYPSYRKYGFTKKAPADRKEGDAIRYCFYNADGSVFEFNNYYLHPATYAAAFTEAGFSNFTWTGVTLDPSQHDHSFWDDFLQDPPVVGFRAVKAV